MFAQSYFQNGLLQTAQGKEEKTNDILTSVYIIMSIFYETTKNSVLLPGKKLLDFTSFYKI